jgi:RNA polymerase sigma-70 factor, ECF subfamily
VDDQLTAALERARGGDREAFGLLYEALAPRVFNYFYHHVGGHAPTAEDLSEEVFLSVLRHLDDYTDRGLPFSAWVFRVAHNRLVDHFRSQKRRPQVSLENAGEAADLSPERELQRIVDRHTLTQALEKLTTDQRNVIVLRFLQHFSLAETAMALDKSEGGVKKLQERALDNLRRHLSGSRVLAAAV